MMSRSASRRGLARLASASALVDASFVAKRSKISSRFSSLRWLPGLIVFASVRPIPTEIRREHKGQNQRPQSQPAEPAKVADLRDAEGQRGEHQRHDDHEYQPQEDLADRFRDASHHADYPRVRNGKDVDEQPGDASNGETQDDLPVKRHVSPIPGSAILVGRLWT